ncbi:MAG: hypothetical protein ACD_5C00206G0010 [uncultured bacterium]|nr:MAG: hypothetical protein ACD_5C00206G0010 [uncultured bacterium]
MKKNVRKALAISGMTLAIGASGLILDASANTEKPIGIQRSHQEKILRSKSSNLNEKNHKSRRSFSGRVSGITKNSITFSNREKTYTAKFTDGMRILNKNWNNILISDIEVGDKIKVFGKFNEGTISAKTVRVIFKQ